MAFGARGPVNHRHCFRRAIKVVACEFLGANETISDYFTAVEQGCRLTQECQSLTIDPAAVC